MVDLLETLRQGIAVGGAWGTTYGILLAAFNLADLPFRDELPPPEEEEPEVPPPPPPPPPEEEEEAPIPPLASFIAEPASGTAPLTVQFTDQSTGDITSWEWIFGDGSRATDRNPRHTFEQAGTYTTRLVVTGPGGSSTSTIIIEVEFPTIPIPAPIPAITFSAFRMSSAFGG